MTSQALTSNSLLSTVTSSAHQPFLVYAITSRPPTNATNTSGGATGRNPIQILCPYTGSNVTSAHPLRVPPASTKNGTFGVRCLVNVPCTSLLGGGGDDVNSTVFVGHGGSGGKSNTSGGKDDHAFLLSCQSSGGGSTSGGSSGGSTSNTNPRWKVRLPEPLSSTSQSLAVSPNGQYLAAGSTNGTCYLWEWTGGEDNLVAVWRAHYRPVSCLIFGVDDNGATLFTGGEDGVVNAWCLLDLLDADGNNTAQSTSSGGGRSIHPFQTWSEHSLPVTSLCVLPGSGCGMTRLVSSSLDRNLIIMEMGSTGARTLARMCLPSGVHTVITNSSSGRLYAGGADGNIYCIDLCRHAIQETSDGAGTYVSVNHQGSDAFVSNQGSRGTKRKKDLGDFESLLSGSHVLPSTAAAPTSTSSGLTSDQSNYISELKGHVKAVTSLALLDPSTLASSFSSGSKELLASGSNDGTLRIWDLRSRSCIKILRPWSTSSESGMNITSSKASAAAASSPSITSIIAVPKSSLTSSSVSLAMSSGSISSGGRKGNARGDLASLFKPLKRFVRGTSVMSHGDGNSNNTQLASGECTPMLGPRRDESYIQFWEQDSCSSVPRKRARKSASKEGDGGRSANDKVEIARLRKELAESQAVIERWQTVNNQLVAKLKSKGA